MKINRTQGIILALSGVTLLAAILACAVTGRRNMLLPIVGLVGIHAFCLCAAGSKKRSNEDAGRK
jgi:hypothetical protein